MRILSTVVAAGILSFSLSARAEDPAVERTWKAKCASCHGDKGDPKGKAQGEKMKVANMADAAWQAKNDDAAIKKAITEGVKREKDGVKQEMKGYKDLKPEQVKGLVTVIRGFKK